MADDISQDVAVRDDVEEVVEATLRRLVVHGSSHDSRSGQDAVLGEPVGQTLQAQGVDHEASCYQGSSVDHEASDFHVESVSSRLVRFDDRSPVACYEMPPRARLRPISRLRPMSRRRLDEAIYSW
eukprot:8267405-Pyramimonas_sp.AAC.1